MCDYRIMLRRVLRLSLHITRHLVMEFHRIQCKVGFLLAGSTMLPNAVCRQMLSSEPIGQCQYPCSYDSLPCTSRNDRPLGTVFVSVI